MGGTCGTSRAAGGRAPLLLLRQKGGPEAGEGRAAAAWDGAAAGRSTRGKAAAAASGRQARWRDRSGEEQTEVVETAVACGKVSQLQRLPKTRRRYGRASLSPSSGLDALRPPLQPRSALQRLSTSDHRRWPSPWNTPGQRARMHGGLEAAR